MSAAEIVLFPPWQVKPDGSDGFVQLGIGETGKLETWEDSLFIAIFAGKGAGKSAAGAIRKLLYVNQWPGAETIIGGPSYKSLLRGTVPALRKLLHRCGIYPNRYPGYEYNKTQQEITWHLWDTGGLSATTYIVSLDDEDSPRGIDAASVWLDEVKNVSFAAWLNLQDTLRRPGYPHQAWITSTPVDKFHWTYWIYHPEEAKAGDYIDPEYADGFGEQGEGNYVSFHGKTRDNPYGGEEHYQIMLRSLGANSPRMRREGEGQFTVSESMVLPDFDPEKHIVPEEKWPGRPTRFVIGVDFGWENPCAILVVGMDDRGHVYIVDEFYRRHFPEHLLPQVVKRAVRHWKASYVFPDPSSPGKVAALRAAGLPVWTRGLTHWGDPEDPGTGIGIMTWLLRNNLPDGSQRLYISPKCVHFKQEAEAWVWPDEQRAEMARKEKPRSKADHLMDCFRYDLMGMNTLRWLSPKSSLLPQKYEAQFVA